MRSQGRCAPLRETELIDRLLRPRADHPAARRLMDDAAVLTPALGRDLVLTHDTLAAGVHYRPQDPPADIAHKLAAVNLSDLAAMGARPVGCLLSLALSPAEDARWLEAFTAGLEATLSRFGLPLIGGDTVRGVPVAVLGLTALGDVAPGVALARSGGRAGERLFVSGSIGDAALGLAVLTGELPADAEGRLVAAYRRPEPRLALGLALRGLATAAIDVSDGLLLDARRLARASGCGAVIELGRLPVSRPAEALGADRLRLASGGDDYELLFAVPAERAGEVAALARRLKLRLTEVGRLTAAPEFLILSPEGAPILPERLGFEH